MEYLRIADTLAPSLNDLFQHFLTQNDSVLSQKRISSNSASKTSISFPGRNRSGSQFVSAVEKISYIIILVINIYFGLNKQNK